jgi:hypothetical protein
MIGFGAICRFSRVEAKSHSPKKGENNSALNKKTKYDNSTLNKINQPVAFAACSPSHLARGRLLYTPREGTRSQSGAGWRLCRGQHGGRTKRAP